MTIHRRFKTVLQKTPTGNVVKIVREHYVRDDIPCGHPSCGACTQDDGTGRPLLSDKPTLSSVLCPFPHYIIPDTNVLYGAVCCCYHCVQKLLLILYNCKCHC